jgi:streptogramin lyase
MDLYCISGTAWLLEQSMIMMRLQQPITHFGLPEEVDHIQLYVEQPIFSYHRLIFTFTNGTAGSAELHCARQTLSVPADFDTGRDQ